MVRETDLSPSDFIMPLFILGMLLNQIQRSEASAKRVMDLLAWPAGWHRYDDERLAVLLSQAFPRDKQRENPTPHRRRVVDEADAPDMGGSSRTTG